MPALWIGNDARTGAFQRSILGLHRVSDVQGDTESMIAGPIVMKRAVEWLR